jgi:SAM-dependent methyltransferase
LKHWLYVQRDLYVIGHFNPVGAIVNRLRPLPGDIASLVTIKARPTDHILDMGCGATASFLNTMARLGFKNLLGADPFISSDTVSSLGVKIIKKYLSGLEGPFDLIMFHHSFEHVSDPQETLSNVRKLLKPGGRCLIRMPMPSSETFEVYGADWVALDPPRHLSLPSREGMQILARKYGFVMEAMFDDSTRFQFVASELYLRNIPLLEQNELKEFSSKTLKEYDKRAARLNALNRGDSMAFVLKAI